MTVAQDIATSLSLRLLELSLGVNCFYGPYLYSDDNLIPFRCVFVVESGGLDVFPYNGEDRNGERRTRVDITIRENKEQFGRGEDLAVRVSDALDMNPPVGYVETRTINTSPIYLRKDDVGSHLWLVNVDTLKVGTPSV
tara:strand:- start:2070 stop:2486 length:417 start_codon:yes stop_codon:yes gene_type:complete